MTNENGAGSQHYSMRLQMPAKEASYSSTCGKCSITLASAAYPTHKVAKTLEMRSTIRQFTLTETNHPARITYRRHMPIDSTHGEMRTKAVCIAETKENL